MCGYVGHVRRYLLGWRPVPVCMTAVFDLRKGADEIEHLLRKAPSDFAPGTEVFELYLPGFGARVAIHGFMDPPAQPLVSEDGRYHAFAEGKIYHMPSRAATLDGLFDHFCQSGFCGWQRINGQFVFMVYDRHERKLHIVNDRFAYRPGYYSVHGQTLFFGTRIKDIIALLPQGNDLRPLGVAELIFFGLHYGGGTLFENIQCLLPARILTFDGHQLSLNQYWKIIYQADPRVTADELAQRLRCGIKRQAQGAGRQGILLSGGLDSRVVAREVSVVNPSLQAFTFGDEDSRDVQYARKICAPLNVEHHHLPITPSVWKNSIPATAWQVEGEGDLRHFRSIQFHPFIKDHCDILFSGHCGDVIMGNTVRQQHLRRVPLDELVDDAFQFSLRKQKHPLRLLQRIFQPDQLSRFLDQARAVLHETIRTNENDLAADILGSWNLEYRQPRFTLVGASTDRCLFDPRSPFLDYDFFDFSLRIPAHRRIGVVLYLKAMWQMSPELRKVPRSQTELPPDPCPMRLQARELAARAGRRIRAAVGAKPPVSYKRAFVDMGKLLRDSFTQPELIELLCHTEQRWHGVLNRHMIDSIIREHFANEDDHAAIITKCLTLHYTEKLFLDGDGRV